MLTRDKDGDCRNCSVMAGHSRSKNGVASLAYVPAIHVLACAEDVDTRHRAGHDE
jgi:hypothetical protein